MASGLHPDEGRIDDVLRRVAALTGRRPDGFERVGGGYTPALRLRVRLAGGRSVFAKAAVSGDTADWLRTEYAVYSALGPRRDFLARVEGWSDEGDGDLPVLLLEDLDPDAGHHWPPPWRSGDVERVRASLDQVYACGPVAPGGLRQMRDLWERFAGWRDVAQDPAPFLSTGLCSRAWLERALPLLLDAEKRADAKLDGTDLCHMDTRSDNVCLTADGRAVIVDWNWASIGSRTADLAGWLPSLHAEGGPRPESILPGEDALPALYAGYWASRAGLPPPPGAPRVREVQRFQLSAALPWAARALGLSEPDGDG
ncbi:MAG TPA: phosphotransferase [Armatimonadaceae bacterium]|nr:phosphotransferase [Armatimonadaceae bacterium]